MQGAELVTIRAAQKAAYALWLNQHGWNLELAMQFADEIVEGPAAPPPHTRPGWLEQSLPAVEAWMHQRFVIEVWRREVERYVTVTQPWELDFDAPALELRADIGERCAAAALEQRTRALLRLPQ